MSATHWVRCLPRPSTTCCGAVTDVDGVIGEAPCLEPSAAAGFDVDEAEVVFWGTCANCRTSGR